MNRIFENMIGRTMVSHGLGELFTASDGSTFRFFHEQDCCESVWIAQVDGNLDDLLGSPLTMAEEISNDEPAPDHAESYTWTFYKFSTANGFVTVRWLGSSNGYYSESVSFEETVVG